MKILHTSDWHLGHRLHEQSQHEEQLLFLQWLHDTIENQSVDILLIAGDVFDTGVPSTQSQKVYYDFLVGLTKTCCKYIVITGGNHDAPGTINAPKELLSALQIHVVGRASDSVEDEVFTFDVDDDQIIVAAVPYLRDQDIRKAVAGESFEQVSDRYKTALTNHYSQIAQYCSEINKQNVPVIAMGHLFAIGGSTSDSEQSIYVGNLGDIGADDFPKEFAYIALGHLHRPQKVGGNDRIRYSGSPNVLSFSEIGYEKKVFILDIQKNKVVTVEDVSVPAFRCLYQVKGTLEECRLELLKLDQQNHQLTPWIEVVLDSAEKSANAFQEINKIAASLNLEVLKVTINKSRNVKGIEELLEETKGIKELQPLDVFKMKCKERDFDLENNPQIEDAFNEVLQIAIERNPSLEK